jgi:hypothetical protein
MVQFLFYRGHDTTPQTAVGKALLQCTDILIDNPTLIVQLENIEPAGHNWDVDIRVMALKETSGDINSRKHRSRNDPGLHLEMENPEHALSGNPDEGRPAKVRHDALLSGARFANAAQAGAIPDLPLQDIKISNYQLNAASEPEIKRILLLLEEERRRIYEQPKPDIE